MMKKVITSIAIAMSFAATAQVTGTATQIVEVTIPEYAMIELETGTLSFNSGQGVPSAAGDAFALSGTTASDFLYMSTMIPTSGTVGTITVTLSGLRAGLALTMAPTLAAGATGDIGTVHNDFSGGQTALTNGNAKTVIESIGTAYTGRTANTSGYKLDYVLAIADQTLLTEDKTTGNTTLVYTVAN